jgi:hypothetical protein
VARRVLTNPKRQRGLFDSIESKRKDAGGERTAGGRWGLNSRQGRKKRPRRARRRRDPFFTLGRFHSGEKDPRRAGTSGPAGSAKKWSRRDGSLTFNIRGVDPPTRVPPVSVDPNCPSPPVSTGGDSPMHSGTGHEFVGCRPGRVAAAGTPVLPAPQEAEGEGIGTGLVGMGRDKLFHRENPRRNRPLTRLG